MPRGRVALSCRIPMRPPAPRAIREARCFEAREFHQPQTIRQDMEVAGGTSMYGAVSSAKPGTGHQKMTRSALYRSTTLFLVLMLAFVHQTLQARAQTRAAEFVLANGMRGIVIPDHRA